MGEKVSKPGVKKKNGYLQEKKMKKIKFVLILLTASIVGCAALVGERGFQIDTKVNQFSGVTRHRMIGNRMGGITLPFTSLNAQKVIDSEGNKRYFLYVEYRANSWIFIQRGKSLKLLIDGDLEELEGPGSSGRRNTLGRGEIRETAWYDVERELIKRIANANSLELRIEGRQYYATEEFSQSNFNNFKKFVSEYME